MRVLLIDDHALFRQGLKFLLSDLDERIVFSEAQSCQDALAMAGGADIDLVLLDLHMPGTDGLDALDAIRAAFEASVIVVLSSEDDVRIIRRVVDSGASGFIPKSSTSEILIAALRLILAGGIYLPPSAFQGTASPRLPSGQVAGPARAAPTENLSARQHDVLLKAIQGKSNKIIAREMNVAPSTVKQHLSAAFRVLGVRNRTEAVFVAAELGLRPSEGAQQQ